MSSSQNKTEKKLDAVQGIPIAGKPRPRSWQWAVFALLFLLAHSASYGSQHHPARGQGPRQPSSADLQDFQAAQALLQQGRLDEAKASIQEVLRRKPSSVEGYNLLGIIYGSQKDYANALAAFHSALKLAPASPRTHNNLGNVYIAQGRIDLAEKEFRTTLRIDPANADGNYNLGVLLMGKGSPAEAIQHFERVHPANLPVRFNLVRAYLQSKRTAEALRMAAKLSGENKSDVQLHFTLGLVLAAEKQYKPAESELEIADGLDPGTFEILYNLSQAYLRDGNYANAELVANRALKLRPESPETLYLLAQVYSDETRPLDALDILVRAHKVAPDNPDVIFLMAKVSISQNYFEDAIPLLESGVKIAPQRADLLAALGESYFMSGKVEKAIDEFQKLVALEPSARSYAFLGLSYRNLGRFDEASEYFKKGLKLDADNNSCLYNLGFIAERQGDSNAAEAFFQQVLRSAPDFPEALLEMANIRIASKNFAEAVDLLRRYVKVGREPSTGYYKLAMVERQLHETEAANRDLNVFQTLSKDVSTGPYPYEHLFDYLDNRSKLAPGARNELDLTALNDAIKKHPDQPEDLYLLAEAYLKAGKPEDARNTISSLDKLSGGDYRTQTGVGVLLARYRMYDDAVRHFQAALQANPGSDEVKFDIANAYFRKSAYTEALNEATQVSDEGQKDSAYQSLLGDIYAHLGETSRAAKIFESAIARNPDNDKGYLSLSLLRLRGNDIVGARRTLLQGQARIPGSGKIAWGLGLVSVLEGNTGQAAGFLEHAVDLMPEWPGSYSTLGVFYFQSGQVAKAREVLGRFKDSNAAGALDVNRIEQVLAAANDKPSDGSAIDGPMSMTKRQQLLQVALLLADRTL